MAFNLLYLYLINIIIKPNSSGINLLELHHKHQISILDTVSDNLKFYSKRKIKDSRSSREPQIILGYPSVHDFRSIVTNKILLNFPIQYKYDFQIIFVRDFLNLWDFLCF